MFRVRLVDIDLVPGCGLLGLIIAGVSYELLPGQLSLEGRPKRRRTLQDLGVWR
jgi:hypothetical protein